MMFSKFATVAMAVLVVSATVALAAAPTTISLTECTDKECKTGCKVVERRPAGKCHTDKFGKKGSDSSMCGPAPTANCLYIATFKSNATTNQCTDANAEFVNYHQCGVCSEDAFRRGEYQTTTCNADGSVVISMGCDETCKTCNHTFPPLKEGNCTAIPKRAGQFVYARAPSKCNPTMVTSMYNSTDCTGTPDFAWKSFTNTCYSGGRGKSHYFSCA